MNEQELIPHLFRTEFRKITAVLCKQFGIEHIQEAEDLASDTFLAAFETWPYKGLPSNPVAWLYAVAKNKTVNYLKRNQVFQKKIVSGLKQPPSMEPWTDLDLSEKNITDSQLQMLFAICHPVISQETQIGLALRLLCGFGIDEIASAFLENRETVSKRLQRGKEKLRTEKIAIVFPSPHEITQRLDNVLLTLYLLFSEGYYSEVKDSILREDLCAEAIRLTQILVANEQTNRPNVNALLALMFFHTSRIKARKNESGELILYHDQDDSLWNQEMIATGIYHLKQASVGEFLSSYHLEAGIAYWHTIKDDSQEKWENILQLYNHLLQLKYSPIAALNRTYALAKVKGSAQAIREAEELNLKNNHFYFTLLGELYKDTDRAMARASYLEAYALAKTQTEKQLLQNKLNELTGV